MIKLKYIGGGQLSSYKSNLRG